MIVGEIRGKGAKGGGEGPRRYASKINPDLLKGGVKRKERRGTAGEQRGVVELEKATKRKVVGSDTQRAASPELESITETARL